MDQFKAALRAIPVKRLKEEVSKYNKSLGIISGYSKMSKEDLITEMSKHQDKFKHLMTAPKKEAPKPAPKKEAPKPAPKKEAPKPAPKIEAPKQTLTRNKVELMKLQVEKDNFAKNKEEKQMLTKKINKIKKEIKKESEPTKQSSKYYEDVDIELRTLEKYYNIKDWADGFSVISQDNKKKELNIIIQRLLRYNKEGVLSPEDKKRLVAIKNAQKSGVKSKADLTKTEKSYRAMFGGYMPTESTYNPKLTTEAEIDKAIAKKLKKKTAVNNEVKEPTKEMRDKWGKLKELDTNNNMLNIKITPPKIGEVGFVADFSKKTPIEQLDIVLKTSNITGQKPNKKFYENIADDFFNNSSSLLNMSPYKAVREFVNKYQLSADMLRDVYLSKTEGDFFPTGKKCIVDILDKLEWYLKLDNGSFNMLEGTSGIGQVGYYFKNKYPNSNITLNELNNNNLNISKLFLNNDKFKFSNNDFFNINNYNYDVIFLNPPFGSKNHFYLKFLLHGLKLLNKTKGNKILIYISPPLSWEKNINNKTVRSQFSSIFDMIKPYGQDRIRIPNTALPKWINELNNLKLPDKDYMAVKKYIDGDIKDLTDNQMKIYKIIEDDYSFTYGETIADCNDFGGTKFNAKIYYFQIIR